MSGRFCRRNSHSGGTPWPSGMFADAPASSSLRAAPKRPACIAACSGVRPASSAASVEASAASSRESTCGGEWSTPGEDKKRSAAVAEKGGNTTGVGRRGAAMGVCRGVRQSSSGVRYTPPLFSPPPPRTSHCEGMGQRSQSNTHFQRRRRERLPISPRPVSSQPHRHHVRRALALPLAHLRRSSSGGGVHG
eukprot:scaffold4716_cov109-Isochrysis_galbana.AAC.12